MSSRDQQREERKGDVRRRQEWCQSVGLLKRGAQTSAIDMTYQGAGVPYDARQLEAWLWQLPRSLLRSSTHSSSRAYLRAELDFSERDW